MQSDLLHSLVETFDGHRVVMIGAAALEFHGKHMGGTQDLDVAVQIDLAAALARLRAARDWVQDGNLEHRWLFRGSQVVDILAVDAQALERGALVLPSTGRQLNVAGFRLVFASATPMADLPSMFVASVPAITVLKMTAYLDRPGERAKDLADLAYVFWRYVTHEDERLYTGEAAENNLWGEEGSTYLLGFDVGRISTADERAVVRQFLRTAARDAHVVRFIRACTFRLWSESEVVQYLQLFSRGLDCGEDLAASSGQAVAVTAIEE